MSLSVGLDTPRGLAGGRAAAFGGARVLNRERTLEST